MSAPSAMSDPAGKTLEDTLVDFLQGLRLSDIPAETREHVKQSFLDTLGAALAGTAAEGSAALVEQVGEWGGHAQSRLIGFAQRVSFLDATIVNTTMARALELDDVHEMAMLHPSVSCIPTALAWADWKGPVSGADLLTACTAGMELVCRLGLTPTYHVAGALHKPRWFSYTYQCGTFGAAAIVAKLERLSHDLTLDALGNAYSQMAGNQQGIQEGVLIVRVQQGLSARDGALGALLAKKGITGGRRMLEGKFGYLNAFCGGEYDRNQLLDGLGETFQVDQISIKPYPCCKITHASVSAALELVEQHDLKPSDIDEVTVQIASRESWDEVCQPVAEKRRPKTSVDAQFSLPFVVASAIVRRRVGLDEVGAEGLKDADILAMAQRVLPVHDTSAEKSEGRVLPMPITMQMRLANGKTLSLWKRFPHGHPQNRMQWISVEQKFRECAARARVPVADAVQEEIIGMVRGLEDVKDVRDLNRLLTEGGLQRR